VSLSWIKFDAATRNETSGTSSDNDGLKVTAKGRAASAIPCS